jgi:hypothetical protein
MRPHNLDREPAGVRDQRVRRNGMRWRILG